MKSHFSLFLSYLKFIFIFSCAFFLGIQIKKLLVNPALETASMYFSTENWGLRFQEEGSVPVENATIEELAPYHAWYAQDTSEKNFISPSTADTKMETHLRF